MGPVPVRVRRGALPGERVVAVRAVRAAADAQAVAPEVRHQVRVGGVDPAVQDTDDDAAGPQGRVPRAFGPDPPGLGVHQRAQRRQRGIVGLEGPGDPVVRLDVPDPVVTTETLGPQRPRGPGGGVHHDRPVVDDLRVRRAHVARDRARVRGGGTRLEPDDEPVVRERWGRRRDRGRGRARRGRRRGRARRGRRRRWRRFGRARCRRRLRGRCRAHRTGAARDEADHRESGHEEQRDASERSDAHGGLRMVRREIRRTTETTGPPHGTGRQRRKSLIAARARPVLGTEPCPRALRSRPPVDLRLPVRHATAAPGK